MTILDTLKEILENSFRRTLQTTEEQLNRVVGYHVKKISNYLIMQLALFSIMAIAIIFLILAGIFAGIEYLHLTATISFFLMGIFLMFIAIIVRITR